MMLIEISYLILFILGDFVLSGGFKVVDEFLDVNGMDAKVLEYISVEDFILYDRHECRVDLVMRNVELPC